MSGAEQAKDQSQPRQDLHSRQVSVFDLSLCGIYIKFWPAWRDRWRLHQTGETGVHMEFLRWPQPCQGFVPGRNAQCYSSKRYIYIYILGIMERAGIVNYMSIIMSVSTHFHTKPATGIHKNKFGTSIALTALPCSLGQPCFGGILEYVPSMAKETITM